MRLFHFSLLALLAALVACEGPRGPAGDSCSVVDNGDGTKTVSCPGSSPVTIANGADGSSCTSTDNGDGTKTISCSDGTSVVVSDGSPCTSVDNGNGTATLTCPGSPPVTVPTGTSCVLVTSPSAEILSCSDGSRLSLEPPLATALTLQEDLPGVDLSILALGGHTNADGSFNQGDQIGVTFAIRTGAGRMIPLDEVEEAGVWLAGPTTNFQHVLPAARDAVMYGDVPTVATLNDDGSYTYVIPDLIPASFGVPLFDTPKYTDGELSGALAQGTYRLAMTASKTYRIDGKTYADATSTSADLGIDTATLTPREVVANGNCEQCHVDLRAHENKFRSAEVCVTCHTSGAEDFGSTDTGDATPVTIDFRVMIHKLHNGFHLPSVKGVTTDATGARVYGTGTPYVVGDTDFSGVLFPGFPNFNIAMPKDSGYSALSSTNRTKEDDVRKGVTDCAACHGDPDGAGPIGAPADGDNAYSALSRRACDACHDDVDWTRPYTANGSTMPANESETVCSVCHTAANVGGAYHKHPVADPAQVPDIHVNLTSLSGATGVGGQFLARDPISVNFTLTDDAGANLPITYLDSMTMHTTGPTTARQIVIPGQPGSPTDFSGRLASPSTSNKGAMSKVQPGGTTSSEILTVEFTSATAFTVTGSASGALASGTLPGSPGTYPSGASIGNVVLTSAAVAQNITVTFTGPTSYSVTGSVSGAMGSGLLPGSTSNTQRFTSGDGTVAFNIVVGSTAAAVGNAFYLSIVKGGANPVLFAVVGGRTAFSTADRFYYEYVAPAASYTLKVPMDLWNEYLGDGNGTAGQVFTAANLPVWYGRQTLLERTGTAGAAMTTTRPSAMMDRYLYVGALDPGLAASDYVVIDDGTGSEEYARVGAVNATSKRIELTSGGGSTGYTSNPLRYSHGAGATVQEVTFTYRQEGAANYYRLDPVAGTITLNGAATAGNAFILSYRTDGRFGWRRFAGDPQAPFYYANLADSPELDETWGDWRGKPVIDGTYTLALWGYHSIELRSGNSAAYEWQTYRATSLEATLNFLYGAGATAIEPYEKINDTEDCNKCHREISFHGGSRSGGDTCLVCHATPGPRVHMRTLAHEIHGPTLPVFPNGAGQCAKCHGTHDVTQPPSRNHPTAQVMPSRDWSRACTGCHSTPAAEAHADTQTSGTSGYEACPVCHGPDRPLPVVRLHMAR